MPTAEFRSVENREVLQGFAYDVALGFDVSDQKTNLRLVFDNPGIFELALNDVKADLGDSDNDDIQRKIRWLSILSTKAQKNHCQDSTAFGDGGGAHKKPQRKISGQTPTTILQRQ